MAAKRARQVRLRRYVAKRDFSRTPEPRAGERRDPRGAPRFFVQRHAATRLHYDFRLELDGALRSWAVPKGPSPRPGAEAARRRRSRTIRSSTATSKGLFPPGSTVPATVVLWDKGTWSTDEDAARALAQGRLAFRLDGQKLHGGWRLVRTGGRDEARRNWLLIKSRDASARAGREADITVAAPQSVQAYGGGRHVDARAGARRRPGCPHSSRRSSRPLPLRRRPAEEWLYEIKYDGYRVLARIDGRDVRLFTRSGKDWTRKLPHLARAVAKLRTPARLARRRDRRARPARQRELPGAAKRVRRRVRCHDRVLRVRPAVRRRARPESAFRSPSASASSPRPSRTSRTSSASAITWRPRSRTRSPMRAVSGSRD